MRGNLSALNQYSYTAVVQMARSGSQEAVTELYNRTYSAVCHTTRALIRDADTAQDVLQDAYIRGFQNLDRLREPEQYPAWMKMIAANTAKNVLKRKKPILFSEMENEDGQLPVEFVDDRAEHLPEIVMDRRETSRLVREILDTLPDDQRLVMGLYYYEQLSVAQIAHMLGVSENTVKSRLNYGRKKVEVKVRELEKRGTRLYSLAPLPFLLMLLSVEASAVEVPAPDALEVILTRCSVSASAAMAQSVSAGGMAASSGGRFASAAGTKHAVRASVSKSASKVAVRSSFRALTLKIMAGTLATAIVGGGTLAVVHNKLTKESVSSAAVPPDAHITVPYTEPVEIQVPDFTEETPPAPADTWETAYNTAIQDYRRLWSTNSESSCPNARNSDPIINHFAHPETGLCYALRDLDGNGVPELFIGLKDSVGISIHDVFAASGSQPVHLVPDDYAFSFGIMNDGTIVMGDYWWGTIQQVRKIAPDGYTTQEIPGDALLGQDLYADTTDFSAHGGKLTGLDWKSLEEPLATGHTAAAALPISAPISFTCVHTQTGRQWQLTLNPDGSFTSRYNGWYSPSAYTIEYAGNFTDIAQNSDNVYRFRFENARIVSSQDVPGDLTPDEAGVVFGSIFELYLPGFPTAGTAVQAAKLSYQSGQSFGAAIDQLGQKIDAGGTLAANEYILLDADRGVVFLAAGGSEVSQSPSQAETAACQIVRDDFSAYRNGKLKIALYFDRVVLQGDSAEYQKINALIQEEEQNYLGDYLGISPEDYPILNMEDDSYLLHYAEGTVSYQAQGILSICMKTSHMMGGVFNGDTWGLNYDLRDGTVLDLNELLSVTHPDQIAGLRNQIWDYLQNHYSGGLFEEEARNYVYHSPLQDFNYYIASDGEIVIVFPTYTLGPGAAGCMTVPTALYA